MKSRYQIDVDALLQAKSHVVLTYGDPNVGKTCFLMALYKFLHAHRHWVIQHNVTGNLDKIHRIQNYLEAIEATGQLPFATTAGEIHELDLLITPTYPDTQQISSNMQSRLFTFLDISGEDCLQFLGKHTDEGPIQSYLLPNLHTTFLYLLQYDEGKAKDMELSIILDYLTYKAHHINRFGLIITHWDKNITETGDSFASSAFHYLEQNMPGIKSKLQFLQEKGLDTSIFPFSIGKVKADTSGTKSLEGMLDVSYCEKFVKWLHAKDPRNSSWKDKKELQKFANLFVKVLGYVSIVKP